MIEILTFEEFEDAVQDKLKYSMSFNTIYVNDAEIDAEVRCPYGQPNNFEEQNEAIEKASKDEWFLERLWKDYVKNLLYV